MGRGGGRYGCPAPPAPCSTVALYLGGPEGDSDAAARDQLTAMPFTLPFGGRSRPPRSGASCVTTSRVGSESDDCGPMQRRFWGTRLRAPPHLSCAPTVVLSSIPDIPAPLQRIHTGPLQTALSTAKRHQQKRSIAYHLVPHPRFSALGGGPARASTGSGMWARAAGALAGPSVVGRIRAPPTSERRSVILVEEAYARPRPLRGTSRGTTRHATVMAARAMAAVSLLLYASTTHGVWMCDEAQHGRVCDEEAARAPPSPPQTFGLGRRGQTVVMLDPPGGVGGEVCNLAR
jgi:hypothetical protein